MRLLIVCTNYAPEKTGTGKYTAEMAEWFAARGHEVHAIVGPPHYPEWKVHEGYTAKKHSGELLRGVHVHRVPMYIPPADQITSGKRIRMETSFSLHSFRPWLGRFLRRNRFDAVIAVCPPMQVAAYPWLYRGLRRVPWVFHIQDLQVDAAFRLGMLKPGLREKVLSGIENFFLKRATRVSTITEAMRSRIVAKGVKPERTWLVPNWADVHSIRPAPRDNEFRRELGVAPGDVLLLYAGNFGKKQGLDFIVRAADRLRGEPGLHFALVGSGADLPNVKAVADELKPPNLRFLPLQPIERLPAMLAAADVHLVVQKPEAADIVMPSKLTNILAAGRPSVATAEAGTTLHDVLVREDAGIVVPYGDLDGFCAAILTLARDAAQCGRMGANARAYAERYLDRDAILSDFEAKLEGLGTNRSAKAP